MTDVKTPRDVLEHYFRHESEEVPSHASAREADRCVAALTAAGYHITPAVRDDGARVKESPNPVVTSLELRLLGSVKSARLAIRVPGKPYPAEVDDSVLTQAAAEIRRLRIANIRAEAALMTILIFPDRADAIARKALNKTAEAVAGAGRGGDALDAARWRAFVGCARIRFLGTAGYGQPDNYRHFGAEFWTEHKAKTIQPNQARKLLEGFADAAIAIAIDAASTSIKEPGA